MNLYKSLLLSAVVVTSFGAVYAQEDQGQQPVAQPTGNMLTNAKNRMTAAVKAEFDRGLVSYWTRQYGELATNKIVLGAGAATVAAGAAGTYLYLKNRQKPTETTVLDSQEVTTTSTVTVVEGSPELTITDLGDGKAMLKHTNFASTVTYDVNAVNALELAIAQLSLAIGNETE